MVTKQNIINRFSATNVTQIGRKQLFTACVDNCTVLISYYTIVGRHIAGTWYLTTEKYSVTTSKQMSQFALSELVQYVPDINNFTVDNFTVLNGKVILANTL